MKHRWVSNEALVDQLVREHDMTGFEHFYLSLDAKFPYTFCHDAKMFWRIDENGFAKIECSDIKRADIGAKFLDMHETL